MRDIRSFLWGGSERTAKLKKNVILSIAVRIGSILCSLVLVPMTIDFVNPVQYGIWLTISSVVAWMSFFDIGFTNGLRNRLAEAIAVSDFSKAKTYVSTCYAILSLLFVLIGAVLCLLVFAVDVAPLLKIDASFESDLKIALAVLIAYFCVTFVLKIAGVVLMADQRPAFSSLIEFMGQALVLLTIGILKTEVEGSLWILSVALCVPPFVVWLLFSFFLFAKRYRYCAPSLRAVKLKYARSLLGLGMKFFVIQIAAIIQFQTANILIARLFDMQSVTDYNVAYKYFNVIYMGFMILLQPFWSAVTNAYSQGDIGWIRRAVKKYVNLFLLCLCGGIVMLLCSDWAYRLWVGGKVEISFTLSLWMLLYFLTTIWGAIFVHFVNGIGALRIQFVSSIVSPVLFYALVMLFCKQLHMGVYAILVASILANYNGLLLAPLQYRNIVVKNRRGIWSA